jgi:hypothetical protein
VRYFEIGSSSSRHRFALLPAKMTGEFTAEHLAKLLQHAMTITAATPDGHLTTDDFTGHQTVKVYFSRTASLYDFSRDPQLSIIRMEPGAEQVFRRIEGLHPETREPIRGGDLTKGVILKMRRGRIDSNIPVDLGFNINGVHGSVADLKGEAPVFLLPVSNV